MNERTQIVIERDGITRLLMSIQYLSSSTSLCLMHLDDAVERHVVVVVARCELSEVLARHWGVEPVQLNHDVTLHVVVTPQ